MAEGLSFSFMLTGSADKALPGVAADSSNAGMEEAGSDNPFSLLFNSFNAEESPIIRRKNSAALAALTLPLSGKTDTTELSVETEGDNAIVSQLLGLISQAEQTGTHWQIPVTEQATAEAELLAEMIIPEETLFTEAELLQDGAELPQPASVIADKEHHIAQNSTADTDISDETEVAQLTDKPVVLTGTGTRQTTEQAATAKDDSVTTEQDNTESAETKIKTESFVATPTQQKVSSLQDTHSDAGKTVTETPVEMTLATKLGGATDSNGSAQGTGHSVKAEHALSSSVSPEESAESKAAKSDKINAPSSERANSQQTGSNNSRDSDANQQSQASAAQVKMAEQAVTTSAAKTDSFADSLAAVEQRQHVRDIQPATVTEQSKSLAEQLKQSLNLLQQDASTQLRERVHLMVRQNIQFAEIRLDPGELGQMQIKVNMQQDQASVQFLVQQPQAKELLEQQLPRLRELLQQQGIQLAEGQVQQQQQQQQSAQQKHGQEHHARGHNVQGDSEQQSADTVNVNVPVSDRLVDYYA